MYSVHSQSLILSFEFDLLGTKLADVEADAEHLAAVGRVVKHVVDVHLFHESIARVTHIGRFLLEKVRLHT